MLHIKALFTNENPLDELIEVLILVTDQCLDLVRLGVSNDLVFDYLPVGRVREHDW